MNKASKIIVGIVAAILLLFIGLFVLAKVVITPERVRDTVVPLAEKALGRTVALGDIEVSLFSGIELHDLAIGEKDGEELFLASDLVRLRYQLLPLFAMQVVVDEVRVEAPRIRVVRFFDGTFNFSDLVERLGGQETPGETTPAVEDGDGKGLHLLVSEVRVADGRLLLFDHLVEDRAPYRHEVSDVQLTATGITLDGLVPVTLGGRLNGAELSLESSLRLKPFSVEGSLSLTGLDALQFKHYFEEALPGTLSGLGLGLSGRFAADPSKVSARGRLTAADLNLVLNALPDAPFENARADIDYDLALDLAQQTLSLEQVALDLNGVRGTLKGHVADLSGTPRVDLAVDVPALDLRAAIQALPAGLLGATVEELDPSGQITAQAALRGTVDKPEGLLREADVTLDKVQVSAAGQRPSLDGRLHLKGDTLRSESLTLGLSENRADLQLVAGNLFGSPVAARLDLTSRRFLLDPLLEGTAVAAGGSAEAGEAETVSHEIGPFDLPLRAEGSIRIDETVWKGIAVKEFAADFILRDNILSVNRIDGLVADGSFHNKARIDLGKKGLAYTATLDLRAIKADPLLSAFAPAAAGVLFGQADLGLAIEGTGTEWSLVSKRLSGDGDMQIRDGRFLSPGLVKGLAGVLKIPDLEELLFETFKGSLRIREGKVVLDGAINSSQLRLYPKGAIGLDGSLDLALDARLSPELAARIDGSGKLARYLQDDQGWTRMPLKVGGAIAAPRFGLDPKGVQEGAARALQQELGERLGEKLFGKPESDEGSSPQEQKEDPATKLLKGLFGQ